MLFTLNHAAGQQLYVQLIQQIRHAIETGVLRHGDALPGIRSLAAELVVSPNTVAKAYSELEHEGLLVLRHGSGAYVCVRRGVKQRSQQFRGAQQRVRALVHALQEEGLSDEEIRRLFEAALFYATPLEKAR